MKKTYTILIIAFITLFSRCKEDHPALPYDLVDGNYTGVFFVTSPNAKYPASNVKLTLKEQTFSGSSDVANYPSICKGTFLLQDDEIEFLNTCFWTADFNWAYILSGSFKIEKKENEIILKRSFSNDVVHTYILTLE